MSYQKIIIMGNIGQIHEPRFTTTGDMVLGFSVAYSEAKDKPTTWFNCTAFKKTGEFVQKHFAKGDNILVEGRIKCEKYTDKQGIEKESWKVDVDKVSFAGGKAVKDDAPPATKPKANVQAAVDPFDSDIPF